MFSTGILGMNARNLSFIKKYNDKTAILLADNKLKTKKYFSQMGVPFARTFQEIQSFDDLKHFSLSQIPEQTFVIKPNKGSKGKGIYILERREGMYFSEGKEISEEVLFHHMRDILDGAYSISGFRDTIIIEERLIPHHDFQPFCTYGLADIRVIVFNYVPVAAMVRIPTLISGGKANINQGGIGMGIDIGTGKISSLSYEGKIYTHSFPEPYSDFFQKKIPDWEKILLFSSRIQGYVDLGYLALDWVVTQDGAKLLEINARAGLEIQNVTGIPLKSRLQRIQNMKIADANKGVSIAKSLFSAENHELIDTSNSLYLSQLGTLKYRQEGKNKHIPITVKVDTHMHESFVSRDIFEYFQKKNLTLALDGSTISFQKLKPLCIEDSRLERECILGTKDIQNFVIKPIHRYQAIEKYFDSTLLTPYLKDLDIRVNELGKYLNVSYHLEATNLQDEKEKFLQAQGEYNPVFSYRFPDTQRLAFIEERLLKIQKEVTEASLEKRVFRLYDEKVSELFCKLGLLKGYSEQDFAKIHKYQKRLYGDIHEDYLKIAMQKLEKQSSLPKKSEVLGRLLSEDEIFAKIQEKIVLYGLPEIEIVFREDMTARISVTTGKFARINLKKGLKMYEKELDAVLAHEIGVHVRRFVNGTKSGLRILKHGTGFYLEDEEGLAIYNSLRYLPDNYEKNDMYIKYYLVSCASDFSFATLGKTICEIYPEKELTQIFFDCLRLKKGIENTALFAENGLSYDKDKIYLNGYMKVKKWVEDGGYIENLMVGKIKIQDIENFTDS